MTDIENRLNPVLLAKLLVRAGHPTTLDAEALVAIRKAYSHCKNAGKDISDAVLIESGLFFKLNTTPVKKWLDMVEDAKERAEIAEGRAMTAEERAETVEATAAVAINRHKAKRSTETAALKKKVQIAEANTAAITSQMADREVSHEAEITAKDATHAAEIAAMRQTIEAMEIDNAELRKQIIETAKCSVEAKPEIVVDEILVESVEAKVEEVKVAVEPVTWTRRIAALVNRLLSDATSPAKIAREILCGFGVQLKVDEIKRRARARWAPGRNQYCWPRLSAMA